MEKAEAFVDRPEEEESGVETTEVELSIPLSLCRRGVTARKADLWLEGISGVDMVGVGAIMFSLSAFGYTEYPVADKSRGGDWHRRGERYPFGR